MINERIIKEVGNVFYARAVGTVIGTGIFYAADAVDAVGAVGADNADDSDDEDYKRSSTFC